MEVYFLTVLSSASDDMVQLVRLMRFFFWLNIRNFLLRGVHLKLETFGEYFVNEVDDRLIAVILIDCFANFDTAALVN